MAKLVDDLEANPKSKGQAAVLSERLAEANATADAEIMRAVDKLVERRRRRRPRRLQRAYEAKIMGGTAGIVGAQNVSVGSMDIGAPKPRRETRRTPRRSGGVGTKG